MNRLPQAALLLLVCLTATSAQTVNDWMRVQTDDGVFSIEVPSEHKAFFSEDGFIVSSDFNDYLTSKMSTVTAFVDGTLFSVEVYDAVPTVLSKIFEKDRIDKWTGGPQEKIGKVTVKTMLRNDTEAYAVSKYFAYKGKIFILLAASRDGNNGLIDRFFSSVDLLNKEVPFRTGTPFSKLKHSDVTMKEADPPQPVGPSTGATKADAPDPNTKKFVLLRRFASSYVPKARSQNVSGEVRLRVYFGSDGFIPHIDVYKKLGGGLVRQTLYAALRMRYLPEEKDGKLLTISRPVTFSFRIG